MQMRTIMKRTPKCNYLINIMFNRYPVLLCVALIAVVSLPSNNMAMCFTTTISNNRREITKMSMMTPLFGRLQRNNPSTMLHMAAAKAGFGAKRDNESMAGKLKPKGQWDRYTDNKNASPIPVAVRVVQEGVEESSADTSSTSEWIQVGFVKSQDNLYTEIAVARQRALIAEHAKRLFPLKVLPKFKIEWAYYTSDEEWKAVNVKEIDAATTEAGIEKTIGFEGVADPASGFYCNYKEGRLVDKQAPPVQKSEGKQTRGN